MLLSNLNVIIAIMALSISLTAGAPSSYKLTDNGDPIWESSPILYENLDNEISTPCLEHQVLRTDDKPELLCPHFFVENSIHLWHPFGYESMEDILKSKCRCTDGYLRRIDGTCSLPKSCDLMPR